MATYPGGLPSFLTYTDGVDDVLASHQNTPNQEIVAIATELGTDPAGTATDVKTRLARSLDGAGNLDFATSTELTISSGSVTPTQNWHTIDTQSDAATDDLDTLATTNVTDGFVLFLRANNDARTVVVKHNTGNILCSSGKDITLDDQRDLCVAIYDAALSKWLAGAPGANRLVQRVEATPITAHSSITTALPLDDTIPQNTEGGEVITVTITPTNAANRLVIRARFQGASNTAVTTTIALFQDSVANALAVASHAGVANSMNDIVLFHEMAAGTTSAITFKIRAGNAGGATTYVNGVSTGRLFGGISACTLSVEEIGV